MKKKSTTSPNHIDSTEIKNPELEKAKEKISFQSKQIQQLKEDRREMVLEISNLRFRLSGCYSTIKAIEEEKEVLASSGQILSNHETTIQSYETRLKIMDERHKSTWALYMARLDDTVRLGAEIDQIKQQEQMVPQWMIKMCQSLRQAGKKLKDLWNMLLNV